MGANEDKTKFSIRVDTRLLELADSCIRDGTARNRTELIGDALRFYLGYLMAGKAEDYLLQSLSSAVAGTVQDSENRLARMDFKIAVELSKLSQVIAYKNLVLSSFAPIAPSFFPPAFPKPPRNFPLFLLIFLSSHLISGKPAPVGGILLSRTALPGGVNRARGLAKATRPLTCTHFNPAIQPRFFSHFGCPAPLVSRVWGLFPPNRPKQGRKDAGRSVYPLFPNKGTNRHTDGHRG